MFDGPKVFGIVLAILLFVTVLAIYVYERAHRGGKRRGRVPERLPLFGTEQLAMRNGNELELPEEPAPPPPRPPSKPRPEARPEARPRATRPEPARPPAAAPPPPAPASPASPANTPTPARPIEERPTAAAFTTGVVTEQLPVVTRPVPAPPMSPAPTAPLPISDLALVEGETLRFTIPTDGTVEFLPGRLEVVAGPDAGKEIRFARAPGDTDVEVTFGRSEGPPNRHVQILARTVSRRHALMSLIDEHWQLTNLSTTNPLVLNGRVLAANEVAPLLVEGDRVEMGEVVFIFHEG